MCVISLASRTLGGAARDRHGRWERDAMDGLVRNDEARRGGRAKACGPDPPMLGSSLPMMIGRRRWLEKPGHRGERAISRKPLRRECRNVRRTCTTCVRMHLPFCTQGCGCVSASGIPCALLDQGRPCDKPKPGRDCAAGSRLAMLRCLTFESVNPAEQEARSIAPRARVRLAAQRDEGEFLYQ